jgi:hypothetical protein
MAEMFKVVPKVGPFRALDFREPTKDTEKLYIKSVDQTVTQYGAALREVRNKDLKSPEINLDTGKPTERGAYPLADVTYRQLLDALAYQNFIHMTPGLETSILQFYDGFGFPKPGTRLDKCIVERWRKTWIEVNEVRILADMDAFDQPVPETSNSPAKLAYLETGGSCTQ